MANNTFSKKLNLNKESIAQGSPLAALYSSEYDFDNLYYPRNLANSTRGHYIIFYINVAAQSNYISGTSYTGSQTSGGYTDVGVLEAAGRTAINQENQAKAGPKGTQTLQEMLTVRKTKRITQGIALYMPETVNVSYNANWQSESLTEAASKFGLYGTAAAQTLDGKALSGNKTTSGISPAIADILGQFASGKVGLGEVQDFALFTQGVAVNPQLQVLFKGTDMRTFSFEFLFTPYDEEEARNVVNIIKTFKFHQAPEVNTSAAGRYFTPPSEFDIDFFANGQLNDKIHQIGTCVLSGVTVDYAPNGWSALESEKFNGMPTQIRMTLDFQETEIVTKERVNKDNY
jgi:hypothetical protein